MMIITGADQDALLAALRRTEQIHINVASLILYVKGLKMKTDEAIAKLDAIEAKQDEAQGEITALIADLQGEIAALRSQIADGALPEVLVERLVRIEAKAGALADIVQPAPPPVEPVE